MSAQARDRLGAVVTTAAAALAAAALMGLIAALVYAGAPVLSLEFLFDAPAQGGRAGGIAPMLVSTATVLGICLVVAVPLALATAIFLTEFSMPGARVVGYALDVLAAVPSIVYALFGYQLFAHTLGLGFSLLSGGLTLACMVLPLIARSAEQALRATPRAQRQAGLALGLSRTGMLWRVVLPTARPGIAAGVVLALGRAVAETAVLLFTAGYVMRMPGSWLDSGRTLAVHIYDLGMHVPGGLPRAAATALVLVALVLALNAAVLRLGGHGTVRAL